MGLVDGVFVFRVSCLSRCPFLFVFGEVEVFGPEGGLWTQSAAGGFEEAGRFALPVAGRDPCVGGGVHCTGCGQHFGEWLLRRL